MSLLAEVIVEEWLNRQGYFTIRGIHLGVDEMDLLAIKPTKNGIECRHIEVQASMRPVSYICRVPKEVQSTTGKAANSQKRSEDELIQGTKEWVDMKFEKPRKRKLLASLAPGPWSRELVIHRVRSEAEVDLIRGYGVQILRLSEIIDEIATGASMISSASGGDLLDLIHGTAMLTTESSSGTAGKPAEPLQSLTDAAHDMVQGT